MRTGKRAGIIAALAGAAILVVGVGYAAAQTATTSTSATTTTATDAQPADQAPGDHPGHGRHGHMVGGEVVKVDGNTITVKAADGSEKSVQVDDQTKYRKPPDGAATLADVVVGQKAGFMLAKAVDGQDPVAKVVIIGDPAADRGANRPKPVVGEVTAVNGDTVTIKAADGSETQVKLPAITPGMRLGVTSGADGTVHGVHYNPPDKHQAGAANQGNAVT
ncbi:MAG: hypothetical protein ACYCXF_09515 [Thermoleophilia bacterium]